MSVAPAARVLTFQPQPGPQEAFLASPADIVIFGGEAGGGKTYGLLLEALRGWDVPGYSAVIFRRTTPEIRNPGGMWDESRELYGPLGLEPREGVLEWRKRDGRVLVKFAGLEYDQDVFNYDGSQITFIGFDQGEHFTEYQFWYLLSRNRSICGVRPYVRMSVNPDPDSWLAGFLAWWIDQDSGYPIPERSGVIRWFVRVRDEIHWADSRAEAITIALSLGVTAREAKVMPKSLTFIPSSLHDNPALMEKDPNYLANLLALPEVERMRLYGGPDRRGGNWKVRYRAGNFFNRAWFRIVEVAPADARRVRYWDKAGTEGGGKFSAGCRVALAPRGQLYIEDMVRGQWSAMHRENVIKQTARADGRDVRIWVEQEPGSGGKESAENTIRMLRGFVVHADRVTGSKFDRARPLAAQAEAGNVFLVVGPWNEAFLRELHNADPSKETDQVLDQMDAAAGAAAKLTNMGLGLGVA